MIGFADDIRHAWRGLIRRPGFSGIVIATLALGIGATTTIYSVVDALLVKPLPYQDANRLVVVGNSIPGQDGVDERGLQRHERMSYPNVTDLVRRARSVQRAAVMERMSWVTSDEATGISEIVEVGAASDGFLSMLGAKPLMGRLLLPTDAYSAVITYEGWQRRFGGDPKVVGKTTTGGVTLRIVGVLPPDFQQPAALVGTDVEFWTYLDPTDRRYENRLRRNLGVLALLKPGVDIDRARRDFAAAQAQLARDVPEGNVVPGGRALGIAINSLRDETIGSAGRPALLFLGASLLLLLLACANASNLLLVRGIERAGELAVRRAIGAGRGRLTGVLVIEGVTLAVAGGLAGLGLTAAGVAMLHRFAPATLPLMSQVAVNPRIAVAGLLLSVVSGVGIGLVPAARAGGADLLSSLRSSAFAVTSGSRLRDGLAATQLALALVLGVAACLLFRSFVQLSGERLGFRPERLVAFNFPLKSPNPVESWDRVEQAVRTVPGVTAVGITSNFPLQTPGWMPRVQRADQVGEISSSGIPGYAISPTYFETAGTPIHRGRSFSRDDRPESPAVAIVNETLVRQMLTDRDPIGARLKLMNERGEAREVEIVGVAGDVVQARVEDGVAPAVYVPYTQSFALPKVLVASSRDAVALEPDIRRALGASGLPPLPMVEYSSMSSRVESTRTAPRFLALLIGAFAATALLLSAIGLYGTLAFTVRSRTRELGIRMALGAAPRQVYRLVLRHGLKVFAIGAGAGLVVSLGVTRLLQAFLFRLSPIDPLSFLAAIALAGTAVLLAALRPAGRAARISPMTSIRSEG